MFERGKFNIMCTIKPRVYILLKLSVYIVLGNPILAIKHELCDHRGFSTAICYTNVVRLGDDKQ